MIPVFVENTIFDKFFVTKWVPVSTGSKRQKVVVRHVADGISDILQKFLCPIFGASEGRQL